MLYPRLTDWYAQYKVTVPPGVSGPWEVSQFEITPEAARLSCITDLGRYVTAGWHTQLTCDGKIIMSDTRAEIDDHRELFRRAKGHVLIHGLGLGMALSGVARKPEVSHVTVVELAEDVLHLVQGHYTEMYGDKVTYVQDDALTWKPPAGQRYGAVWHDIWPTICETNLEQMKRLHRRFGRRAEWQGSWAREQIVR